MLPFPSCLQSFEEFEVDWEDPIDYNLKILNENLKRKCKLYTTLEKKQYLSFKARRAMVEYLSERAFHIEDLFVSLILIRNFRFPYSYTLKR